MGAARIPPVTPLAEGFSLRLEERPFTVGSSLEKEVDRIWSEALLESKGKLYDGEIFHLSSLTSQGGIVQSASYRHLIAAWRSSSLRRSLSFYPIGVRALVRSRGHLLVGLRADWVGIYPGKFELAPSGGLDRTSVVGETLDYRGHFFRELREECGMEGEAIATLRPFRIVAQPGLVDLVLEVSLHEPAPLMKNEEYALLEWWPEEEVVRSVTLMPERWVATIPAALARS